MSDYPRRRRLEPEPPKGGGGIPLFPLVILVILGGLLLGGLLTRFFGNPSAGTHAPSSEPSFTPLPGVSATIEAAQPTLTPLSTPQSSARASASAKPTNTPSAAPSAAAPLPSASAMLSAAPAQTARAAAPVIIITPSPAPTGTPSAAPAQQTPQPAAAATATPVLITGTASREHAAAIVRAYIGALANGDTSTATGYLASGIPSESFINPNVNATINDLRTVPNGDGSFTVTAQIATSKGSYLETFTVTHNQYGMQITDHNPTKM